MYNVAPPQMASQFGQGAQLQQMGQMRAEQMQSGKLRNAMLGYQLHNMALEAKAFSGGPQIQGAKPETYLDRMQSAAQRLLSEGDMPGGMKLMQNAQNLRELQYREQDQAAATAYKHLQTTQTGLDQLAAQLPNVHNQAQWQAFNQQVQAITGGPSPFANMPFSPQALQAAQGAYMNLKHQIALKQNAIRQRHNELVGERVQEQKRHDLAMENLRKSLTGPQKAYYEERAKEATAIAEREKGLAHGGSRATKDKPPSMDVTYPLAQSFQQSFPDSTPQTQSHYAQGVAALGQHGVDSMYADEAMRHFYDPKTDKFTNKNWHQVVQYADKLSRGAGAMPPKAETKAGDKSTTEADFEAAAKQHGYTTPEQMKAYRDYLESQGYTIGQ